MQQLISKPGLLGLCSNLSQCKIVLLKSETVYLRSELGSLALLVYSIWKCPFLVLKKMVCQTFKRLCSNPGKILASCFQLQILRRNSKLEKKLWGFFQQGWKQNDIRIPTALLLDIWSCSSHSSPVCAILSKCYFLYVGTANCQVPVFI